MYCTTFPLLCRERLDIIPITDWIFSGSRDATARLWALEDPGSGTGWIQKTLFKGHTSYVTCLVYSSSDEQYKHVRQAFLLTPAAEKSKTQNINSTSEVHFLHNEKNSRKKTISNFSLETEIFLWGVTCYAIFMNKKFKFFQFPRFSNTNTNIFRKLKSTYKYY